MDKIIIAVDFDGTLCIGNNFPAIGEPRLWLIEALKHQRANGAQLILWTCRENHGGMYYENSSYLDDAVNWCKSHGLEFDAINQNINEAKYPSIKFCRKVVADIYLDDKAGLFSDEDATMTILAMKKESGNYFTQPIYLGVQ